MIYKFETASFKTIYIEASTMREAKKGFELLAGPVMLAICTVTPSSFEEVSAAGGNIYDVYHSTDFDI